MKTRPSWKVSLGRKWREFRFFLSNPVALSYSKISTYQNCPYKYKTIYIEGQPGKPTPALAFGTVLHNTVYEFELIKSGRRGYDDLERLFRKNWESEIASYGRQWGRSLYHEAAIEKNTSAEQLEAEAFENGIQILKNYLRAAEKSPNKIRHVEKWIFAELFKYRITGRMDRVDQRPDGFYEIIDYKTGERIYDQTTLKDASRGYGLQAGLYYEMTRESWRDRVTRFVFRYLQKRQDLLDFLMEQWMEEVRHSAHGALEESAFTAKLPDAETMGKDLTTAVESGLRDKLLNKILVKVVAEREEDSARARTQKISPEAEEKVISSVAAPEKRTARAFIKVLNKALEAKINGEVSSAIRDQSVLARYDADVRSVLEKVLAQVDSAIIAGTVAALNNGARAAFERYAADNQWPEPTSKEQEAIAKEILEIIYHQDVKDFCERNLGRLDVDALARRLSGGWSEFPELREGAGDKLVAHVVKRLRETYPRHFDVYSVDEISRRIAGDAPDIFLAESHRVAVSGLIDSVAKAASADLPGAALEDGKRGIINRPLILAIKRVIDEVIQGIGNDISADKGKDLTELERARYERILKALGDPIFTALAARKFSAALAKTVFHENHFQEGIVPLTKHVTDLFERPAVISAMTSLWPGLASEEIAAKAQGLIEKMDWRDAEAVVTEALKPGFEAWVQALEQIITPRVQSALAAVAAPEKIQAILDDAAAQFENQTSRLIAEDVEVPYSPEMRENIHRVLDEVQEGIRRNEFPHSKGALCGWCEYQSGCPAWCKYQSICKGTCGDVYHCKKWYDEETKTLRLDRPKGMSVEEHRRRVNEKFELTDRSLFRLSFSKMNTYDMCPMNYRKLYLDHVPPQPKSFFSIGLSYHSTMEDLYVYDGPDAQPSLDQVKAMFKKKWVSAGYKSPEEEDFYFRRGLRMCEDYYAKFINGQFQPAYATEEYFEFKVGRTLLNGFIDRVDRNEDGSFVIVDYKTNPKVYTAEELEDDQQMTMYYLAAREGKLGCSGYQPFEPQKFVFNFVNFCRELVTHRKPSDLEAFVDRVGHFTDEMDWRTAAYKKSGFDPRVGMILFPPQDNKYCQSCDHHHICPLKSDVTVSEEIEKKGIHFEDLAIDTDLLVNPDERKAGVDASA